MFLNDKYILYINYMYYCEVFNDSISTLSEFDRSTLPAIILKVDQLLCIYIYSDNNLS